MDQDSPQEELADDLFVPDLNSADPEERKLARRIRINKRVESLSRQQKTLTSATEKGKATLLQNQLEKSSQVLRQLFLEADQQVTNVRVANDSREVARRGREGILRAAILQKLQEDATLSIDAFEAISTKWSTILAYNDPLNIAEALQTQREKSQALMSQKDAVIEMLREEIRAAEGKFYVDQQSQNEDIRTLAKRVEKQVALMRAAHATELQHIEDVMVQERGNMMDLTDRRWSGMYERREDQERALSDQKRRQREEFEGVVSQVRVTHGEKLREVRIHLERDCEILLKEFQDIKACSLKNSEKMDGNYQILKKRQSESIVIKSDQKRRLNQLQDSINSLRRKIVDHERRSSLEVGKLCEEVASLQKCISDEERKSKSVSVANDRRYFQVWELNRREANTFLEKILAMDKYLWEEQLGLSWEEPHEKLLIKEELPSYKLDNAPLSSVRRTKTLVADTEENLESEFTKGNARVLKIVLEAIAEKSGFLLDTTMKNIISGKTAEEDILVKIDNVFDSLGILHVEDTNLMLGFFRPYITCPLCKKDTKRESLPGEENHLGAELVRGECLPTHPLCINPSSVLRALREFVTKVMCQTEGATDRVLDRATQTASRLLSQKDVREYWDRYKTVLDGRTSDLWQALLYGMKKYLAILEDRHKLNKELKCLEKQNGELRHLLQRCKDGDRLQPPCVDAMSTIDKESSQRRIKLS